MAAAAIVVVLLAPASALAWRVSAPSPGPTATAASTAQPRQAPSTQPTEQLAIGSTLQAPADRALESGQDWVSWFRHRVSLRGAPAPTVNDLLAPVDGQITSFSVKGIALTNPGAPPPHTVPGGQDIHLIDLVPQPFGCAFNNTPCTTVFVDHASAPFPFPDSGDPQQISTFHPLDFCVHQGDYLGFASEGGFVPGQYQNGVPFQVFSQVSGSTTDFYTKHGDIMNGHEFAPQFEAPDFELLMQGKEVTGSLMSTPCPGTDIDNQVDGKPLTSPTVGPDGSLSWTFNLKAGDSVTGTANIGKNGTTASVAARLYAQGSVTAATSGPATLKLKTTRKGKRAFRHRANIPVSVHLAFRSSAKLGSTTSSKDFRVKVKGKKHH